MTSFEYTAFIVLEAEGSRGQTIIHIYIPRDRNSFRQSSLLWWTVALITGVGAICLYWEVAGWDSNRGTGFPYGAETAGRWAGGVGRWADGAESWGHKGLWERLSQWRRAAGVSAWGWPDRPISSVDGSGEDWSAGNRGTQFWLAKSITRAFFQTLQSLLKWNRDNCVLTISCHPLSMILFLKWGNDQIRAIK